MYTVVVSVCCLVDDSTFVLSVGVEVCGVLSMGVCCVCVELERSFCS